MQLRKMECLPSRTGRDLQRYNVQGCRQVVGCIPYRIAKQSSIHGTRGPIDDLEFLLVSSQKSPRMMFPKGGWEVDESLEEAAIRESFEEAGIYGEVGVRNTMHNRLTFILIFIYAWIKKEDWIDV
ncbi:unnamed protein product [Cuscuta epithymum]|uniref:Nudix hydrolase domain-containing protein n=1 Tax=Cuscuta epithymum TaxID=186058 RepID=A0AAV0E9R3_9ASTE|nr:unnamed protein product [Cuscuta epithymum]